MSPTTLYRYLLVDLDGTLLDNQGALPPRNAEALWSAVAAGMTLVLASGRTYLSLLRLTDGMPLPPFHIIANGGALALAPGGEEVRYANFISEGLWPEVALAMEAEGLTPIVFGHRHPDPPLIHLRSRNGNTHHETYVTRNAHLCREHAFWESAAIAAVVEVAALGRDPQFEAASQRLLGRFDGRVRSHSMMLTLGGAWGKITEVFAPGTSKWQALGGLFPAAFENPATVIAIGDEANDLEMIQAAGFGIAMGNGVESVKAVADHITGKNSEHGVALAIEGILAGDLG